MLKMPSSRSDGSLSHVCGRAQKTITHNSAYERVMALNGDFRDGIEVNPKLGQRSRYSCARSSADLDGTGAGSIEDHRHHYMGRERGPEAWDL